MPVAGSGSPTSPRWDPKRSPGKLASIPRPQGARATKPCGHCQAPVTRMASHMAKGTVFCSNDHKRAYWAERKGEKRARSVGRTG